MSDTSWRIRRSLAVAMSTFLLGLFPSLAAAQQPPARIGNTWDGRHHEPNPDAVITKEEKAGIRPSQAEIRRENQTVERLYQRLERRSGEGITSDQHRP